MISMPEALIRVFTKTLSLHSVSNRYHAVRMGGDKLEHSFQQILKDCMEQDKRIPEFLRCLWQRIVQEMSQWNQENR